MHPGVAGSMFMMPPGPPSNEPQIDAVTVPATIDANAPAALKRRQ